MRKTFKFLPLVAALALTGCMSMAPSYERPQAPILNAWPTGEAYADAKINQQALPDWHEFFTDERLRKVIELTLENNRDYRVAMLNVQKMRYAYNIQRSEFLPSISGVGSGEHSGTPRTLSATGQDTVSHVYSANLAMASYELDLFGRIRSLSDEALNQYFATEEARKSARVTLIAETANLWLQLGADRSLLAFAKETLDSQEKSYKLSEASYKAGAINLLELNQAKQMYASAQASYASSQRAVAQDMNALALLVGTNVPEDLLPNKVEVVTLAGVLPQGVPSEVLLNRPDIAQAEYTLLAANADIGAAVQTSSRESRLWLRAAPVQRNWMTSSRAERVFGALVPRFRFRFSPVAPTGRRFVSLKRNVISQWPITKKPFKRLSVRWPTR